VVGQLFVPSLFPFLHRARGKVLLARAPGVTVNFLRRLMASDCHDLAVLAPSSARRAEPALRSPETVALLPVFLLFYQREPIA
jgi:hypothetical protein